MFKLVARVSVALRIHCDDLDACTDGASAVSAAQSGVTLPALRNKGPRLARPALVPHLALDRLQMATLPETVPSGVLTPRLHGHAGPKQTQSLPTPRDSGPLGGSAAQRQLFDRWTGGNEALAPGVCAAPLPLLSARTSRGQATSTAAEWPARTLQAAPVSPRAALIAPDAQRLAQRLPGTGARPVLAATESTAPATTQAIASPRKLAGAGAGVRVGRQRDCNTPTIKVGVLRQASRALNRWAQ